MTWRRGKRDEEVRDVLREGEGRGRGGREGKMEGKVDHREHAYAKLINATENLW